MIPFTESHSYPSYSQAGEDRIVFYLFERLGNVHGLRYADIGASTPAGHNNTYLFYTLGGRGLLVEADPVYLPAYQLVRPNDVVESLAIVPNRLRSQNFVTFHRMHDRGWSTVSPEHKITGEQLGKALGGGEEISVSCLTINEVLERYFSISDLDLLSLDIEGVDTEVIRELNFNRFKPKVLIIENSANLLIEHLNGEARDLPGYYLFASTYVNSIFVRQDCMKQFVP
jgi:FkbM family methyltransferase